MKKFLFLLASLVMITGMANAHEIWVEPQTGNGGFESLPVYNNSGATLDAGDVVVWDIGNATGDNDLWVTTTTTVDTAIVAGIIYPNSCAAASVCNLVVYGTAECDTAANTSVADGGLLCTKGTAGGGGACNNVDAAYAISAAATGASSQGLCFVTGR